MCSVFACARDTRTTLHVRVTRTSNSKTASLHTQHRSTNCISISISNRTLTCSQNSRSQHTGTGPVVTERHVCITVTSNSTNGQPTNETSEYQSQFQIAGANRPSAPDLSEGWTVALFGVVTQGIVHAIFNRPLSMEFPLVVGMQ